LALSTFVLNITNVPPTASISGPTTGTVGTAVTLTASATDVAGNTASLTVAYTVTPATPAEITITAGDGQFGTARQPFPTTLAVVVKDAYDNPLPGISVTFTVTSGSATFPGGSAATATTDASGRATAPTLTAGRTAGPVTVTAAVTGSPRLATAFTETVLAVGTARADIQVSLTAPATAARGTSFIVTIRVTNAGPNPTTALVTSLTVRTGLTVTNGGGGTVGPAGHQVRWNTPSLAPGATLTYTVTVSAAPSKKPYSGTLTALGQSSVPDPAIGNNTTTTTIQLT
jgi:hypothetical protein